ncbi:Protein vip1 [Saxophila tyrrhenica]|uniref:Protein vip1 n=1 Tax=Saxophila tyrrhenica TaxID=1690608 RepID=A0AAV9P9R4_9PEZI|nr:Protein vip1 [Saxophila tyrrhenica]
MSSTVHVKNIAGSTSEKEVRDFFSFCGKIQTLSVTPDSNEPDASQSASVTFEKETAAKTALLLDNTQLGPAQVSVSSASSLSDIAGDKTTSAEDAEKGENIAQEDKPRSRIVAEYLAHGYVISDKAIERALALDQQHGMSNRFMSALKNFDSNYKVSERSAQMDQRYGASTRVQQAWGGLNSYFEKAANTPTGQRLRGFYEQGSKQVLDVHNEARHLASLQSGKGEGDVMNPNQQGGPSGAGLPTPEQAEMEKVTVDGQEKTKCNCGGADGKCPCPPGQCACSGCSKAS